MMAYKLVSLGDQEPKSNQSDSSESSFPEPLRQIGGYASRALESGLGFIPSILEAGRGLGSSISSLAGISGENPIKPTQYPQSPLLGALKQFGPSSIAENIPSSVFELPSKATPEKLREYNKKITGETFEPKGPKEENVQEWISTLTPLFLSGMPLSKSATLSGLGQGAKWAAQQLDVPKSWHEPLKTGTILATSLVGIPDMKSFAKNLYSQTEAAIPANATISGKPIVQSIQKITDSLPRTFPKKKEILEILGEVQESINPRTNSIPLSEAWKLKKGLNDWLYTGSLPRGSVAREAIGKASKSLKDHLLQEGGKISPEFSQNLSRADDIWASINANQESSTVIGNAINKIKDVLSTPALALLGYLFPAKTLAGAAAFGAGKGVGALSRAAQESFKRPGVQYYYKTMIESALHDNQTGVIKALKGFNKEISNEQKPKNNKYKIVSLGSQ